MSDTKSNTGEANAEGSKAPKSWSGDESIKLLMVMMANAQNKDLSVSGWKNIGEKSQTVFGGKYGPYAVKHQFQKLRRQFLQEFPDLFASDDEEQPAPATKGKKRTVPSDDTGGGVAKKSRATKAPKATKGGKNADEQGDDKPKTKSTKPKSDEGESDEGNDKPKSKSDKPQAKSNKPKSDEGESDGNQV